MLKFESIKNSILEYDLLPTNYIQSSLNIIIIKYNIGNNDTFQDETKFYKDNQNTVIKSDYFDEDQYSLSDISYALKINPFS